jgi:hypothetical protein
MSNTQNILIEVTADVKGVTTLEDAILHLDKTAAAAFGKTNTAVKENEQNYRKAGSALVDLTENITNVGKASAGAFSTKSLAEYQAAISKTLKDTVQGFSLSEVQAKKFFKSIQDEARKGLLSGGTEDEMKQFQASLNAATEALKALGEGSDEVTGKTQSLRAQLRQMREELATIDDPSSPRFIQLATEAAELEDRISDVTQQVRLLSSDTSTLDAGIQAVNGLAGAFAVAQGAVALLGDDNEELQKTLVNVNAAMSIMQGLQQVGQLLDKNSALNVFLIKTLRMQQAVATEAVAASEAEAAVATEALAGAETQATATTVALNTAMSANPAAILILSLTTLVGLITIFTKESDKAARAQEQLNLSLQEGAKTNDSFIESIKQSREKNKAELEKSNASASAIRENDLKSLQEQLQQTKAFEDSKYKVYVNANERLRSLSTKTKLSEQEQKEVESLKGITDAFNTLQQKRFDLENQLEVTQIQHEGENFRERLKSQTAFVQAHVLQQKEGSREELVAQIAAIRARENEELKSSAKLPGEVAQIRAQADKDAQKVTQQIRIFDLNQQKLVEDAKLQNSKEGSEEELRARLAILKIQAKTEIEQANGNSKKILDIKAKEKRDEFELVRTFDRKIVDNALAANIAEANSRISKLTQAGARVDNQQLLNARVELLEAQAQVERVAVERSIDTAENKRVRIRAINEKELADKIQLERDKAAADINENQALNDAFTQIQINRANRGLNAVRLTSKQREKFETDLYNAQILQINNTLSAEEERYNNGIISEKDYLAKKAKLEDDAEALRTQKAITAEQRRAQAVQSIQQNAQQTLLNIGELLIQNNSARYNAEVAEIDDLKNRKIITEEEAAKRTRAIRLRAAKEEKEMALFSAFISQGLAVLSVLRDNTIPSVIKPFAIATAIAEAVSQIALIASRPLPQLKSGVKKAKAGVYRVGEIGQELMWHKDTGFEMLGKRGEEVKYVPEGARVFNAAETRNIVATMAIPSYSIPSMAGFPKGAISNSTRGSERIDYEKMADAIARKLPGVDVQIDEKGIAVIAKKGLDRTQYLNNRYTIK